MAYCLAVFDPDLRPVGKSASDWINATLELPETRDIVQPAATGSKRLARVYDILRMQFPPLNGPHAVDEARSEANHVADYAFLPGFIYVEFTWAVAEAASRAVLDSVERCGLGLFDPQDAGGGVICEGVPERPSWLARLFKS